MSNDREMTLNEYQQQILDLPVIWKDAATLSYLTLSLVGEAGELAEKVKKSQRINSSALDPTDMAKELGDVLWSIVQLSKFFGYTLEEVAQMNLDKLISRAERNVLEGSGDER